MVIEPQKYFSAKPTALNLLKKGKISLNPTYPAILKMIKIKIFANSFDNLDSILAILS